MEPQWLQFEYGNDLEGVEPKLTYYELQFAKGTKVEVYST